MNYWYAYLAPQRLLYFKYNVCENDSSNPFTIFASQVLNTFDSNPADTFVFDLRGNTGGDSSIINPILQGLQQRIPVILANPNFRVYVAIHGGTFSSGWDDAMEVKSNAVAAAAQFPAFANSTIVIGEPSGGPPAGYGEVLTFSLPYQPQRPILHRVLFPAAVHSRRKRFDRRHRFQSLHRLLRPP